MEPLEKLVCGLGLVGLEMSDQVPGAIEAGERGPLRLRFLDTVLAEISLAGVVGLPNALGRKGLGNRDQLHILWPPSRAFRGARHALANALEVFANFHLTAQASPLPALPALPAAGGRKRDCTILGGIGRQGRVLVSPRS